MKKTLTENITRYDNKMRLRLDMKTFKALSIALLPSVLVGGLLCKLSIMIGLPIMVLLFLGLAALQIGLVEGVPLYRFLRAVFASGKRREYLHLGTAGDRLTCDRQQEGGISLDVPKTKERNK